MTTLNHGRRQVKTTRKSAGNLIDPATANVKLSSVATAPEWTADDDQNWDELAGVAMAQDRLDAGLCL